MSKIWTHQR